MPVTYGVLDTTNYTDPGALFSDDNTGSNGNVGDLLTITSYNYTQITTDAYPDDGGTPLNGATTINGTTYPDASDVEMNYEVIVHDTGSGLYYRVSGIWINNELVGIAISKGWDATTGQYVDNSLPSPGTSLTAIDGDDLDGTPNVTTFVTDSNYSGVSGNDGVFVPTGMPICFAGDTLIETRLGPRRAQDLRVGDSVLTRDNGFQPVTWVHVRHMRADELAGNPSFRPIRIAPGAMGDGVPRLPLIVSPQHRLLIRSRIARRMFGCGEVLVAARQLLALPGIAVAEDLLAVDYVHVMCPQHEVIFAEGAPAETLYMGDETRKVLPPAALRELHLLMHLPARPLVAGRRAHRLAQRHLANRVPLHAAL